jgi:hypothetical protein
MEILRFAWSLALLGISARGSHAAQNASSFAQDDAGAERPRLSILASALGG